MESLHGVIESSTEDVHKTFLEGLKEILTMQNNVYQEMSEQGWYTMESVEKLKLESAKKKFLTLAKGEE